MLAPHTVLGRTGRGWTSGTLACGQQRATSGFLRGCASKASFAWSISRALGRLGVKMAKEALAMLWRSGAGNMCSIKRLHRSNNGSTMTSWSMGSRLVKRPNALAFNRRLRGPPTDNLRAHPQVVQGRRFGMGQSKAHQWIHAL